MVKCLYMVVHVISALQVKCGDGYFVTDTVYSLQRGGAYLFSLLEGRVLIKESSSLHFVNIVILSIFGTLWINIAFCRHTDQRGHSTTKSKWRAITRSREGQYQTFLFLLQKVYFLRP